LVQLEELATKITLLVSNLQIDEQGGKTLREKSYNFRKMVSREIVCFKIIFILKPFNIKINEYLYF